MPPDEPHLLPTSGTHGRIAALGLLTIAAYGSWFYGFGVLLDDMRIDLATSDGVLAGAFALAQLLTGVFGVLAGHVLDRVGPRPVFAAGATLGAGSAALAAAFVDDALAFVVVYGVGGGVIGACGFYGVTQTIAARLVVGQEARSISRLTVWGAFASPLLIPATELSRRTWGWRTTIVLSSVAVTVAFALAATVVGAHTGSRVRTPMGDALRRIGREPQARRLARAAAASSAAVSVLLVYQVPVMTSLGVAATTAATIAAARGLAQLLGRLPLAWFVARVGVRDAVRVARSGVAVGAVVLLALAGPAASVVAVLYVVVVGTAIGALSPLDGIFARAVLGDHGFGTLMGVLALSGGVAAAVGPLLAAVVVDATGWRPAAAVLAAALALVAAWSTPMPDPTATAATTGPTAGPAFSPR